MLESTTVCLVSGLMVTSSEAQNVTTARSNLPANTTAMLQTSGVNMTTAASSNTTAIPGGRSAVGIIHSLRPKEVSQSEIEISIILFWLGLLVRPSTHFYTKMSILFSMSIYDLTT